MKSLPVPPARPEAKAAALAAARAAFEASAHGKSADPAQDDDEPARLTGTTTFQTRSRHMRYAPYYAMAASVAALVVAAPIAMHVIDERGSQPEPAHAPAPQPTAKVADTGTTTGAASNQPAEPAKRQSQAQAMLDTPAREQDEQTQKKLVTDQLRMYRERAEALKSEMARRRSEESRVAARLSGTVETRAAVASPPPMAGLTFAAPNGSSRDLMSMGRGATIASVAPPRPDSYLQPAPEQNRDRFESKDSNPVKQVAAEPVSTFSIDVDTASYSFMRRALNAGRLPPKAAVRVEELINYFPYDYAPPDSAETPFKPSVEVVPAPWNPSNKLVHIAIKGYDLKSAERPRANLVFLVDVSGSMAPEDRLPLVKNALRMLLDTLRPEDTVAIVTYASGSGVALEPTKASDKSKIIAAIDGLKAGGSTAGAQGIQDAYRIAEAGFDKSAVNRVVLATDGDFNVGITNRDELKGYIERKRQSGIFLSILGVGRGNYNDALMQTLAQNGNGTAAYVDTLNEARKVLVEESSSTLFPIAKDVKIQIEFNPARVSEYRLIGYESRMLKREDFNNDKVDAGDVGSGRAVTAIYEITPVGAPKLVDDLRYKQPSAPVPAAGGADGEIGYLKLRYKLPKEEASRLTTFAIGKAQEKRELTAASQDVRFSIAVAAFGQMLRGLPYIKTYTFDDVIRLANGAKGTDAFGYRTEFVNLVRLAKSARP
ncbi:MAG: von Willebrand factor type A domain-containing protein [Hyphomicrobiaceae bacterium]